MLLLRKRTLLGFDNICLARGPNVQISGFLPAIINFHYDNCVMATYPLLLGNPMNSPFPFRDFGANKIEKLPETFFNNTPQLKTV